MYYLLICRVLTDLFSGLYVDVEVACNGTCIAAVSDRDVIEHNLSVCRPITVHLHLPS